SSARGPPRPRPTRAARQPPTTSATRCSTRSQPAARRSNGQPSRDPRSRSRPVARPAAQVRLCGAAPTDPRRSQGRRADDLRAVRPSDQDRVRAQMTQVGYPGPPGSHSAAASIVLAPPGATTIDLPSFTAVVDAAVAAEIALGVLPIESSLAGPVSETHDLIYEAPLSIVRE